jgi:hypothetical protein
VIVNTYETKAFVCLQRQQLKSRLGSFYASTLDSKLARTFTDDVDLSHGADRKLHQQNRPGQRDDENICTLGRMLPI